LFAVGSASEVTAYHGLLSGLPRSAALGCLALGSALALLTGPLRSAHRPSTVRSSPVHSRTSPAFTNFCAGLVAGIAVDVPLHPLDTIKTRLQAPGGFAAAGGLRNLWGGLSPVILRSLPCSAIFFVAYDHLRHKLNCQVPSARGALWCDAVAGSAANVAACSVRVPCEVLKQRMQASLPVGGRVPSLRATVNALGKDGLRSFYTGFGATVSRELAFAAVQMPLFEQLKRWNPWADDMSGTKRGLVGVFAGGTSGAVAGAVTTPMDVAKTRAMLSSAPMDEVSVVRALSQIYSEGGAKALFRGVIPRTAYVGVSCALSFGAFEWSKWLLMSLQGT